MRDMLNNKQVVHLGNVVLSGTTPAASSWVDLKGFDACSILVVSNTITDAGTASGFTATLQEGDDSTAVGATAVAVHGAFDALRASRNVFRYARRHAHESLEFAQDHNEIVVEA